MVIVIPTSRNGVLAYVVLILLFGAWCIVDTYNKDQEWGQLHDFNDLATLKRFLTNDRTDLQQYTSTFVCEDFSEMLMANAKVAGFRMEVVTIKDPNSVFGTATGQWLGDGDHAMCLAHVANEHYFVEPQTDEIFPYVVIVSHRP